MPISGRFPRFVEGETSGSAAEAGTLSGLAFHLSAGVPFGESGGCLPRVAFVPECSWTARQPVRYPEGAVYGQRCRPCPLPGRGGRAAWLRGVGRVARRGQRLQQHPLGQDMLGPRVWSGNCGVWCERSSGIGVSSTQDSVLDPLLWSIAYDAVLWAPITPDSALACYADDTLMLVWGTAWGRTAHLAELTVACVVAAIKGLGLRMSPEKSEAMWCCRRTDHGTPPVSYHLRLEGTEIGVGTSMKYLSLTLDSHWSFGAHFECLAPFVETRANALECLLSRLDGLDVGVRRLYAGVVRLRLLYGAPIWAEYLMASRRSLLKVRKLHRTEAISVVRGFRTISAAAAAVLAGFPPFELQALRCREIYLHTRGLATSTILVASLASVRGRRTWLHAASLGDAFCTRGGGDRSRDGHRGGFSRLESGTITPLHPRSGLVSVRISSTLIKKKKGFTWNLTSKSHKFTLIKWF